MPKPNDFFIGVLDFFAILLPGGILTFLLAARANQVGETALFWVALLTCAYIAGHLVHAVGSLLDVVYDWIFGSEDPGVACPLLSAKRSQTGRGLPRIWFDIRTYPHRIHQLTAYVGGIIRALPEYAHGVPNTGGDARPAGVYQWARAWLRLHSPEATTELDRLEADSKLFRSLTVIAAVVAITGWPEAWKWTPNAAAAGTLIGLLSLWRYFDLRQKSVRACYLHFLQLHSEKNPTVQ